MYAIVSEKSISLIQNIRPPALLSLSPIVILTLSSKDLCQSLGSLSDVGKLEKMEWALLVND